MTQSLTCQELVEIITEYLEQKLPTAERVRFEAHLAGCTGCRNYLNQMQKTIRLVGHLSEETIPAESQDELLQLFHGWQAKE
jgi:predicted anti-sigma-YlaC factor YlaD